MMKASQDRLGSDDADTLNCSMERGIFVELAMNSRPIIIVNILPKDPTQMRLPKYDHVVETFPSDRADQPLGVPILKGSQLHLRDGRLGLDLSADNTEARFHCGPVDEIRKGDAPGPTPEQQISTVGVWAGAQAKACEQLHN
jgi:hypothetical protein